MVFPVTETDDLLGPVDRDLYCVPLRLLHDAQRVEKNGENLRISPKSLTTATAHPNESD